MFLPGSERGNVQNITTVYVVAIGEHAQRSENRTSPGNLAAVDF